MGGVGFGRVPGAICRAAWGPFPAVFLASSSFLLWLLHFSQSPEVPADFCMGVSGQRGSRSHRPRPSRGSREGERKPVGYL